MPILEAIRAAVPETARVQLYTYVAAGVLLLSGLGYVADSVASLWSAVGIASVTLAFALLHSTSPWRTALYGFLVALAPLALWYSIGTATGWAAVLAFAATVFGITKAASNTVTTAVPVVIDESGTVRIGDGNRWTIFDTVMPVTLKIKAQGKAFVDNLNAVAGLGVPIWTLLAAELDATESEVADRVRRGEVDSATYLRALHRFENADETEYHGDDGSYLS